LCPGMLILLIGLADLAHERLSSPALTESHELARRGVM
jgi:hypothetical protein